MESSEILEIASAHPSVEVSDGATVVLDGDESGALYVLAEGTLRVLARGAPDLGDLRARHRHR